MASEAVIESQYLSTLTHYINNWTDNALTIISDL